VAIVIIAEKDFHRLYRSFSSKGDTVYECIPKESTEVIEKCKADLILLDCGSNVNNGLQLLKDIKARHPGIPVIFLTEVDSEDAVLKAFKTGARDFFKKPVNIFELQETVDGILSLRKSTRESRHPYNHVSSHKTGPLKDMTTSQPVTLINVINYIDDNLSARLNLDILAEKAGLSKYHFCRIFTNHIGFSPMKFIMSMRIAKAKALLKREEANISKIASSLGFNDLSSFTVQFKKVTGTTPIKFRKAQEKIKLKKFSRKQLNYKK
jgi:YesN/AraC family two-component response regulator